ncbi:MAG: type VI secretion system tip protein VgrG [Deltaproteobacteria bacterium]|nr:type VI secretion system tip protein VgrG [Deltaproteobacteria bacterium]
MSPRGRAPGSGSSGGTRTGTTGSRSLSFVSASDRIGTSDLVLTGVSGHEELSRPYEHELRFECGLDQGLDEEQTNAALSTTCTIDLCPDQPMPIHGVLRSLTMLPYHPGEPIQYHGVLVPRLWRLGLGRASRVFQNATVPAIVLAILRMNGLQPTVDFDVAFQSVSFSKLAYCVQYEESDLAFVSRLLEEHGLFYLFDQSETCERIVLADDNAAFRALGRGLHFRDSESDSEHDDGLRDARLTRRIAPREVRLRPYRTDAAAPPVATAKVDEAVGYGVVRHHREPVEDQKSLAARATARAQALRVRGETMDATTSALGLHAGARFDVGDHPLLAMNRDYYVLSVRTTVSVPGSLGRDAGALLRQTFEAVPLAVPFRLEQRTPRPKLDGVVNAVIDGARDGVAAPIDGDGAYRVLLPFDALAVPGGRASRPIHRVQPSAGAHWGTHFPLHIGTEVVLSHIDGDPDRPVIVGAVPNAAHQSPVTSSSATKDRVSTRSGVLIEIDDASQGAD